MCQIYVLCYQTKTGKRGLFAKFPAGIKHLAETTEERRILKTNLLSPKS